MRQPRWQKARTAAGLVSVTLAGSFVAGQADAAPQTSHVVGGIEVTCNDFRGRQVHIQTVQDLGDVGRARMVRGMPVIVLDTTQMRKLPPKLQLFFYAHECAHHVLGHWYKRARDNESAADCWAIQYGRDKKFFSRYDVVSFAPWFARSRGTRWGHLPGPLRAKFLVKCFDSNEIVSVR